MACLQCFLMMLVIAITNAASINKDIDSLKITPRKKDINGLKDDLKTASSSYSHQYSDWGGNNPGGYGFSVTGFGTIDDKFSNNLAYKGFDGYDNSLKNNGYSGHNNIGFKEVGGFGTNEGYGPYKGYVGNNPSGYNSNKFGPGGYGSSGYIPSGFGPSGYASEGHGANGYGSNGYEGSGYTGNGGYGGYGGNGGLNSYNGYNNPYYKGAGHLGYGYYNKGGHGNIYSSGVTPSLVTGYRGYTRR